jgi:DNA polymerase-4
MYEKAVLHLDLDCFFVECERLHNPALKGKPVIVGGNSRRGVVASASYEARKFGIRAAMPMQAALQRCPDAIVVKGDYEEYAKQSGIVTDIIEEAAPVFEKASIDEFYLDLTGMDKYVGCALWAKELREKIIRETGLFLSGGLAVNKTVSKISTGEAKPNNLQMVASGSEKNYIAPLSILKMPSIGKDTYERLTVRGIRTIGALSQVSPNLLERQFGKHGIDMWRKANAIDDSPIVPYRDQKSISTQRTFQEDTIDIRLLKDRLTQMVTELAFELRKKQQLTSCITVKVRYNDFQTFTAQKRIPFTANDKQLISWSHQLFDNLYQRRVSVRLLGVRFGELVHGNYQILLFEDTQEDVALLGAMDKIRKRFGTNAIMRASTLGK